MNWRTTRSTSGGCGACAGRTRSSTTWNTTRRTRRALSWSARLIRRRCYPLTTLVNGRLRGLAWVKARAFGSSGRRTIPTRWACSTPPSPTTLVSFARATSTRSWAWLPTADQSTTTTSAGSCACSLMGGTNSTARGWCAITCRGRSRAISRGSSWTGSGRRGKRVNPSRNGTETSPRRPSVSWRTPCSASPVGCTGKPA